MPFGFLTDEGPQRWFANVYHAREMPTKSYPARTVKNVQDSAGTLWFGTQTRQEPRRRSKHVSGCAGP